MSSLPVDVVEFARSYIRSLEDLRVLIICADHRDRWWDADGLARRTVISEPHAARVLDRLAKANLLDIRISDAVRYRFNPGTDELTARAEAFTAAYHKSPGEIAKLIARRDVPESVRDFAEAFRIKRDDSR
jgi:hypothetical protein